MKIFKLLFILLIPAMSIVGCRKSDAKPCSHTAAAPANSQPSGMTVNSDESGETTSAPNYRGRGIGSNEEIYGSGDDDRDGGDKKLKKQGMTK